MSKSLVIACSPPTPPTIGQREDGSWYWLDETWNEGDNVKYNTYAEAVSAQNHYCSWLLEGAPDIDC